MSEDGLLGQLLIGVFPGVYHESNDVWKVNLDVVRSYIDLYCIRGKGEGIVG